MIEPKAAAQVAEERDVSIAAVAAAVHSYRLHRCSVDALLEANPAALR